MLPYVPYANYVILPTKHDTDFTYCWEHSTSMILHYRRGMSVLSTHVQATGYVHGVREGKPHALLGRTVHWGLFKEKIGVSFCEGLMRRKQARPGELEHSNIIFYPHGGYGAFKHRIAIELRACGGTLMTA